MNTTKRRQKTEDSFLSIFTSKYFIVSRKLPRVVRKLPREIRSRITMKNYGLCVKLRNILGMSS